MEGLYFKGAEDEGGNKVPGGQVRPDPWQLTHQHLDLKRLFRERVAKDEAKRAVHVRSLDVFEELKRKHAELQAQCRLLEERLRVYVTALNLLALENAALADRDAESAKVRIPPRRREPPA